MLHVERIKQAAPEVPGVVALHDILAAVVEVAVAEQEAEAAQFQVVLVVPFDSVRDEGEADLVDRAMPAGSGIVGTQFDRLIDLRVCEGLVLTLVPAEAAKDAQVLRNLLLGVVAEAVFERAEVLVKSDGGNSHSKLRRV